MKRLFLATLFGINLLPTALAQPNPSQNPSERIGRAFVGDLQKQNFKAACDMLSPSIRDKVDVEKLKDGWNQELLEAGSFQGIKNVWPETFEDQQFVSLDCRTDRGWFRTELKLKDNQVVGLWFDPFIQEKLYSIPTYVSRESFVEKILTVGATDWPLPAILSLPRGKGPFPLVLLIPGSGESDADETTGPNKTFRDLAWGMATRGIASLRVEKRTFDRRIKLRQWGQTITPQTEYVDDAGATLAQLRTMPEIDPHRIFLLGDSRGGTMLPRIAHNSPFVAGLVFATGESSTNIGAVVERQAKYQASLKVNKDSNTQAQLETMVRLAKRAQDPGLSASTPESELPWGCTAPYILAFRNYDPLAEVNTLSQPMLFLQGDRDFQVTLEDFACWKHALSNHKNVAFQVVPGLNHMLRIGSGPANPEEYSTPGNVEPIVISKLIDWILAQPASSR